MKKVELFMLYLIINLNFCKIAFVTTNYGANRHGTGGVDDSIPRTWLAVSKTLLPKRAKFTRIHVAVLVSSVVFCKKQ